MEKKCNKCFINKPLSDFHKDNKGVFKVRATCKLCRIPICHEYIKNGGNKVQRKSKIKKKYLVSDEEYLYIESCTNCQVCDSVLNGHRGATSKVVDHSHNSNKFRGVLCSACNLALGHAKDSIKILQAMVNYLEKELENVDSVATHS
jgi:hypothetical protein